jgi:putative cell wall-binding protein
VKSKRKTLIVILILCCSFIIGSTGFAAASSTTRLFGQTRYETAKAISEYYNPGKVQNVILTTGTGFADALSACVFAHQKKAPILLTDISAENSQEAMNYITQHLDQSGTVYLIGGIGAIGKEFENKLNTLGFNNIVRIAGSDRYETCDQLARSLDNATISTAVISSGESYPDALSIAGFAANKGWPILLTPQNFLPPKIKEYLLEKKPSKIYITGGTGVISENVKSEINDLLPGAGIERLAGKDRFETNIAIAQNFNPYPLTLYLATGYGFADALAGSVLAAGRGDPIILIDPAEPTLPKSTAEYFRKLYANGIDSNLVSFGGIGVVSNEVVINTKDLISGIVSETSIYSIADITATVTQRDVYYLPATVQARLYNSETIELPVKWNSAFADTGRVGSSVYTGAVDGYGKTVKLYLTVLQGPISRYSTYFDLSLVNRTNNIRLASKALDGILLAPGARFSFNKSVGERTVEAGYKEALIISEDTFIPGIGGGVCQVSSTLYNAALLAHLEILERHAHTLPISYVPPGQDATVSYPDLDLKFRNSLNVSLMIRSSIVGNTLTFALWEA